jgi:uncharacterized damage-inducible protein DinB
VDCRSETRLLNAAEGETSGETLPPFQPAPLPPLPESFPISATNQPAFADLETAWTEQAKRTRALLAGTTDWNTAMPRRVEHGETIIITTLRKSEIATQMLMHEVHHRAQAMSMLRQLGVEAQNLDYIDFVARRQEYPKDKAPRT